jgi:hypothetical protein
MTTIHPRDCPTQVIAYVGLPRSDGQKQGVDMIHIANGCAKRTYKSDFWRNRCVNHRYFLICTQGQS